MKAFIILALIFATGCTGKLRLDQLSDDHDIRTFPVASLQEARSLMEARLEYLRRLLIQNGNSPQFQCGQFIRLGSPEAGPDQSLVSISDIFFTHQGNEECPGPISRPGFLVMLFCPHDLLVREYRVFFPRNGKKVQALCSSL